MLPDKDDDVSFRRRRLKLVHEMHKVRDFRPVLCADMWDRMRGYTVWELKQVVALEFDDFSSGLCLL